MSTLLRVVFFVVLLCFLNTVTSRDVPNDANRGVLLLMRSDSDVAVGGGAAGPVLGKRAKIRANVPKSGKSVPTMAPNVAASSPRTSPRLAGKNDVLRHTDIQGGANRRVYGHTTAKNRKAAQSTATVRALSAKNVRVRQLSQDIYPILVKWKDNVFPSATSTSASGSRYVLPLKTMQGKDRAAVLYDLGRNSGIEHLTAALVGHYIHGIVLSHVDGDHSGGIQALSSAHPKSLQHLNFFTTSMPGDANLHGTLVNIMTPLETTLDNMQPPKCFSVLRDGTPNGFATMDDVSAAVRAATASQMSVYKGPSGGGAEMALFFNVIAKNGGGTCTPVAGLNFASYTGWNANRGSLMAGYIGYRGFVNDRIPGTRVYYMFTGDSDAREIIADSATLAGHVGAGGQGSPSWDMMEIPHHGSGRSAITTGVRRKRGEAYSQHIAEHLLRLSKGYFVSCAGTTHHISDVVLDALTLVPLPAAPLPLFWIAYKPTDDQGVESPFYTALQKTRPQAVRVMFDDNAPQPVTHEAIAPV